MDKKFEMIYKEYFKYSYKIISNYVAGKEDIEDLVSEVFLNIWNLQSIINSDSSIKSLVITISKRRVADYLRKKYKLKDLIADAHLDLDIYINEGENQNSKLVNKLDLELLAKDLKKRDMQIYKLKYKEKKTYSQIAKEMGITKNYAKVLNNRLIKTLKNKWEKMKK